MEKLSPNEWKAKSFECNVREHKGDHGITDYPACLIQPIDMRYYQTFIYKT